MKRVIFLLILAIFATSANGNVIFSDDFESGSLDQWIIAGRQQHSHGGVSMAEVVNRHGSQMAHLHQSDFTEITLEKMFAYKPNLSFSFDMEVSVSSGAGPTDDDYAMGGAFFGFLDSAGELIGFVRYIRSTSSYPFTIINPLPSREYIALPYSSLHSYSFTLEDILSHITVDTDSIASVNFSFWAYNSGWGWNMSADVWVDNVVVSVPELVGLEIAGPNEVAENFSASYKAIAHYDNDSTRDVTNSALWAVEPNTAASIDEDGILITKDVVKKESATILASYTEGDVTVEAQKAIDILAICPTGTALKFDGVNDYVDFSRNIITTTEFTVSAWANHYGSPGGSSPVNAIFQQRDDASQAGYAQSTILLATEDPGDYAVAIIRSSGCALQILTCPMKNYGEWHRYSMTVDSNDFVFYVDGVEVNRTRNNQTGDYVTSIDYVSIGRHSYRGANRGLFNGAIDEVAIYNRALSAEEIQANMHRRLAGDEPGLLGYWDFDESEGQIAYDLSSNGNDGQLGPTPNPDSSDPAWVDSDAPVGICSLYQSATVAIENAVERKTALLEELLAGLAGEWTAYEALDEWFESGDYVDFNKGDIVTAKQKIHSAMQHEGQQSIGALDKSVEKLKDALSALGYDPDTAANIDENGVLTTKDIVKYQSATILASHTERDVTVDAEKAIDILAICPSGSALSFDGDDYVSVPDSASLDITGDEITVVAWFKPGATGNNNRPIVSKWLGSNSAYVLWYKTGSIDLIGFAVNTGGTAVGANPTPVNDINKWYHLAGVYDGSYITVYVDGVPGEPVANTGNINNSSKSLRISGYGEGAVNPHHIIGLVDYVQLYDRALSAEEIQANMHRRLAGDEPGLVGYWDFDEGGGQIVYDLSVSGNDGQLGSTPNPDVSDPAWVDSDAPIGICTPYLIAKMATERAVERKTAMLEELLATLAEEWLACEALEELLESGDYGDLNKGDIVTAKQKIHSATQHEEQAIDALEKSIEKLKDALSALEPPILNQPPNVTITKPQDGAVFGASETIEIEANAWDIDGSIVKVEFFANGNKIGEDNDGADGWKSSWNNHPVGSYSLTAKATDNDGATTTSPAVGITVVETPLPGQASNPNPADGATNVSISADLSWTAGPNAASHGVYFGMASPGTFRGNQTATTFDPGTMAYGTTYYWRIDEVNAGGTTTGTVWSFTTGGGGPPR